MRLKPAQHWHARTVVVSASILALLDRVPGRALRPFLESRRRQDRRRRRCEFGPGIRWLCRAKPPEVARAACSLPARIRRLTNAGVRRVGAGLARNQPSPERGVAFPPDARQAEQFTCGRRLHRERRTAGRSGARRQAGRRGPGAGRRSARQRKARRARAVCGRAVGSGEECANDVLAFLRAQSVPASAPRGGGERPDLGRSVRLPRGS